MKYIKASKSTYSDIIGIALSFLYLFSIYLSGSVFFPTWLNRITLLAFLAYGAVTTVHKMFNGSFYLSRHAVWYAVFICYTVTSLAFSTRPEAINSSHLYQMLVCLCITLFVSEYITTEKIFNYICWAFILSSFLMVALLYASGKLSGDYNERLGNEVSGNANTFATFIMYSVIYGFWLLISQNYRLSIKVFLCFSIIINLYALMLSAGRKFFVIPFVFLYILLLLKSKNNVSRSMIKYTLLMLIIVYVIYLIMTRVPVLYNAIGVRMEQLINSITGSGTVDQSSIIRSQMRKAAITEWKKSPLFGYGFDTFKYLSTDEYRSIGGYSHCNFTELLYSGGLVYISVYYSFFLHIIYKAFQNFKKNRVNCAFAIAVIVSQLILDYGGVFYDIAITQLILMMAAIIIQMPASDDKKEKETDGGYRYGKSRYIRSFAQN